MAEVRSPKQIYDDSDWMPEGACHPLNNDRIVTNLFVYISRESVESNPDRVKKALGYCGLCPVRDCCLDYGLSTNQATFSIYGGAIISPRRQIFRNL